MRRTAFDSAEALYLELYLLVSSRSVVFDIAFLIVRLEKTICGSGCLKRMLRRSKGQSGSAMRSVFASPRVLLFTTRTRHNLLTIAFTTRTRHNLLTIACRLHYIGDIRHWQHRARVAATALSVVALVGRRGSRYHGRCC